MQGEGGMNMAGIIGLMAIPTAVLAVIMNGYAMFVLWGWFVVPLGVAEIGVAHAIGLASIVSYMTHQDQSLLAQDRSKSSFERLAQSLALAFGKPLVLIAFGWIVASFMA